MVKINFKKNDVITTVEANVGENLLEVAKNHSISIIGGCDGAGVCGTCHVHVDGAFKDKLNEETDSELDILDVLPNANENSRLACQVLVNEDMDGITIELP